MLQQNRADYAKWLINPAVMIGLIINAWAVGRVLFGPLDNLTIPWLLLASAAVAAGVFSFRMPGSKSVVTISDMLNFSCVLLFGLPQAVIAATVDALVSGMRKTKKVSSILFNAATMAISIFIGGQAFHYTLKRISGVSLQEAAPWDLLGPLTAMAFAHYLANSILIAGAVNLRYGKPMLLFWKKELLWASLATFSSAAAAGICFLLVRMIGFAALGLLTPILLVTYFSYKFYTEKLEEKNQHIQEISRLHLSAIECLATAIDAKDQVTHGHIRRVQIFTLEMAKRLGIKELEMEGLRAAALLHDIGKLGIPEYILNKPTKLTDQEFEKIKLHPQLGADILSAVEFPYPVVPAILHHHERWDGKGYPSGLIGEQIPIAARILSLVDFFDALTSDRPYRKAMSKEQVLQIIGEESGKMFDPKLAKIFCENIDSFNAAAQAVNINVSRLHCRQNNEETQIHPAASADSAAGALSQIASANKEVAALYELARNLGRCLDIKDLLMIIGNKMEKLVPFTDLVVYLCDPKTDTLVASHVKGSHGEVFEKHSLLRGQGVSGWAVANRVAVRNANPELNFNETILEKAKALHSLSVFPLFQEQENLGCLAFYSTETNAFSQEHASLLEALCEQISMAIANSLRYEQTRQDSLTDALTGLPNSRYFYPYFEQELAKAKQSGSKLSLVAMDLDGFKAINDTHGHQAGNQILRDLALYLRRAIRESDTMIRYAGDEFIAVLPNTGLLEAQMMVSRLQQAIDEFRWCINEESWISVGLSLGCSCYPEDGTTLEEVLSQADRRMYANKNERRQISEGSLFNMLPIGVSEN